MEIPKNLKDEIWEYCRVNNISNIDEFTLNLVKQGFTVEKFGATPVGKERVVEKTIEVPVEKIVEKQVFITDDKEVKKLADEVTRLTELDKANKKEITKLTKELEEEKKKKKGDIYGEN